jgi:hypothetical protein
VPLHGGSRDSDTSATMRALLLTAGMEEQVQREVIVAVDRVNDPFPLVRAESVLDDLEQLHDAREHLVGPLSQEVPLDDDRVVLREKLRGRDAVTKRRFEFSLPQSLPDPQHDRLGKRALSDLAADGGLNDAPVLRGLLRDDGSDLWTVDGEVPTSTVFSKVARRDARSGMERGDLHVRTPLG